MERKSHRRYRLAFAALVLLLAGLAVWNINSGSIHLSIKEIFGILAKHEGGETSYNIIWEIRLPRILAVIILGGALSVSGFLLQTFFPIQLQDLSFWGFHPAPSWWYPW